MIVEDDLVFAGIDRSKLQNVGSEVHLLREGEAALKWLENNSVELLLLDLGLPKIDGWTD